MCQRGDIFVMGMCRKKQCLEMNNCDATIRSSHTIYELALGCQVLPGILRRSHKMLFFYKLRVTLLFVGVLSTICTSATTVCL